MSGCYLETFCARIVQDCSMSSHVQGTELMSKSGMSAPDSIEPGLKILSLGIRCFFFLCWCSDPCRRSLVPWSSSHLFQSLTSNLCQHLQSGRHLSAHITCIRVLTKLLSSFAGPEEHCECLLVALAPKVTAVLTQAAVWYRPCMQA